MSLSINKRHQSMNYFDRVFDGNKISYSGKVIELIDFKLNKLQFKISIYQYVFIYFKNIQLSLNLFK